MTSGRSAMSFSASPAAGRSPVAILTGILAPPVACAGYHIIERQAGNGVAGELAVARQALGQLAADHARAADDENFMWPTPLPLAEPSRRRPRPI